MRRLSAHVCHARGGSLPKTVARPHYAGGRSDALPEMSYLELLKLASAEAIVVLTALVVLAIGLSRWGETLSSRRICALVAAIGLLIAVGVILVLPRNATLFAGMLVISPLNSLFKIICLGLALVTVALTGGEKTLRNRGEYLAIVLLATVGLMLLVGSEELLMIFIGLELLGLSLYVMTAFDKIDIFSAEAGLKYFLFGSTASAFTLFGISLVYGMSGSTALATIAAKLTGAPVQPLLAVGIVMTLIGFAFKIAAAPFHLWAADAYQGAPVTICAGARPRRLARDDRRLVARAGGPRRIVDLAGQFRRARPDECSPAAGLLCRCPWRLHFARLDRRRTRRIRRDPLLYDNLRNHAHRRVRCRGPCAPRHRWGQSGEFWRLAHALARNGRVHVDLHVVARRNPAAGRLLRQVLPFQRCAWGR
ncbi:MAG: hypothetical protein DME34_03575 [Verrucomicrobia bacterium]|nr:MAG: hypothetical protein DME34_03575 [Verrucomicrobiota bacterium]